MNTAINQSVVSIDRFYQVNVIFRGEVIYNLQIKIDQADRPSYRHPQYVNGILVDSNDTRWCPVFNGVGNSKNFELRKGGEEGLYPNMLTMQDYRTFWLFHNILVYRYCYWTVYLSIF